MVNSFPAINISATRRRAYKTPHLASTLFRRDEGDREDEGVGGDEEENTSLSPSSPSSPASPYPRVPHSGRNFCHVIKSLLVYFSGR
ncbi:hypothetical protein IQ276_016735 [Desmonostoc muscorum LEGE 12446]|uniref:hypothetical protein n=1 Tax=Desmonostoc muscorum TaxID=1179 RepID=UPI001F201386|nr:hypothetical protein [Desmonostoc muscorum]MCF2148040.1 hypothetical protein [Desmonostoc muscorum LEGE 12446]